MTAEQNRKERNLETGDWYGACETWMSPDRLSSFMWAMVFIWAGVVILGSTVGYVDAWRQAIADLPYRIPFEVNGWSIFFVGAGTVALVEASIRLLVREYRKHIWGTLICAGFVFGVGTDRWDVILPVVLVAVGLSMLPRLFSRKSE